MIAFNDFKRLMLRDLKTPYCLEFEFSVLGKEKYSKCKIGKKTRRISKNRGYVYWISLGKEDERLFLSFEEMIREKIFDGLSFGELWDKIVFSEKTDVFKFFFDQKYD